MSTTTPAPTISPPVPAHGSGRTPALRIAWLLSRPGGQGGAAVALPMVAFAVTTALLLLVVGGTMMFWSWTTDEAALYRVLSLLAVLLLVIPLTALGGAAARLSARRRDDRLATLRLLGATPAAVARVTIAESTAIAVIGALGGIVLYAVSMPLVGLLRFGGSAIGAGSLWVGIPALLGIVVLVTLVATVSAALGLRGVTISPLGVRTRQNAPRMHGLRLVIGVLAIVGAYAMLQSGRTAGDEVTFMLMMTVPFGVAVGVLNLIGPWAVERFARIQLRGATTTAHLMAARSILESPKASWRQVSGLAMTSFVAVAGGSGMAFLHGQAGPSSPEDQIVYADVQTGIVTTLVISFVMVACSVGVNQAAAVFDRRDLWVNLDRTGMPRSTMEAIRTRQVFLPMAFVAAGSALIGGVLALPAVGGAVVTAPLSLAIIALAFVVGFTLVFAAQAASGRVLTRVLAQPDRV